MTEHFFRDQGQGVTVPGTLRGYRAFDLCLDGNHLRSTGVMNHWPVQGDLEARCLRQGASWFYDGPWWKHDPAESPAAECVCGIYGWYDPQDTRLVPGEVFGVIEASGRILLASHGFRAQRAKILALACEDPVGLISGPFGAQCLRDGFIPRIFSSIEELVEHYPQDDLSGLIQHSCNERCRREEAQAVLQALYRGYLPRPKKGECSCMGCVLSSAFSGNPTLHGLATAQVRTNPQGVCITLKLTDETEEENPTPFQRAMEDKKNRGHGPAQTPFRKRGR